MKRVLRGWLVLLVLAACDSTPPSVPTTIVVDPTSTSFDAVGETRKLTARVFDQRGDVMSGVPLTWTVGGTAAVVTAAAGDSAVVTSAAAGSSTVNVKADGASVDVPVIVAPVAASILKIEGDQQSGNAGAQLPVRLRVVVRDRLGTGVAGVQVAFVVTQGSGSVSETTATTAADGTASTSWTLGTSASASQQVTVTSVGNTSPVIFSAIARAGPPASIAIIAGNDQRAEAGTAVAVPPAVRVADGFGNFIVGAVVTFTVTAGGGSVTGGTRVTDVNGVAIVGSWILGPAAGANSLQAAVTGSSVPPAVINATATPPLPRTTLAVANGGNQATMAGTTVPIRPAVLLSGSGGVPIPGVTVTFEVVSGGGSVTGAVATTNSSGIATVGSWVLGPVGGPNTLRATASGTQIIGNPVTFTGVGCEGGGPGYKITLCFRTSVTGSQRTAFENAAAKWASVIAADVPDMDFVADEDDCGFGTPRMEGPFDDLVIFATLALIDGPGSILGGASPCYIRLPSHLPVIGTMVFDSGDLPSLESQGRLQTVILHEMGHVIGVGTIWEDLGLLENPSSENMTLDTYFDGPAARAAFDAIGGTSYTRGFKVPVENSFGEGTRNSHWRESVLQNELMTGFISLGANPLSLLTVRSLEDLGYVVSQAAADPFFSSFSLRAAGDQDSGSVQLVDDVGQGPLYEIDQQGRRRRIR